MQRKIHRQRHRIAYTHGSETVRRDGLVRRFNFTRASHKQNSISFTHFTNDSTIQCTFTILPKNIVQMRSW